MDLTRLTKLAAHTVEATRGELPAVLRETAAGVPVTFQDWPSGEILGDEFEPDILGLFVGPPHGAPGDESQGLPAQILLFTGNLWEFAEGDDKVFCNEVRITYLHELGHYFGWDEEELAERGLE